MNMKHTLTLLAALELVPPTAENMNVRGLARLHESLF